MTMRSRWLLLSALAWAALVQGAPPKAPRLWRGIDVEGMDTSRKLWEDFYQFANGKWLAQADIPPDRPSVYVFTLLDDRNREVLRHILEETARDRTAPADSIRGKVGAF